MMACRLKTCSRRGKKRYAGFCKEHFEALGREKLGKASLPKASLPKKLTMRAIELVGFTAGIIEIIEFVSKIVEHVRPLIHGGDENVDAHQWIRKRGSRRRLQKFDINPKRIDWVQAKKLIVKAEDSGHHQTNGNVMGLGSKLSEWLDSLPQPVTERLASHADRLARNSQGL